MKNRLIAVLLILGAQTVAQTKPAQKAPISPKERMVDFVYVGYFGLRSVMSEEMWSNLKAHALELEQREPTDKTGELLVHFINAEIARTATQFDVAEAEFRKANGLNSSDVLPFLGLAETALDRGDGKVDVVPGLLYLANALVPKSVPDKFQHAAFIRIGELYERSGEYTKALEAYEAAVKKRPTWATGRRKLAATYISLNEPSAALPHIEKAIVLEPKEADNYVLLGDAQSQLEQSTAALKSFKKAAQLDPGNASIHYRLGLEYEDTGAKFPALRSYTTAKMIAEKNNSYADLLPDINQAITRIQEQ